MYADPSICMSARLMGILNYANQVTDPCRMGRRISVWAVGFPKCVGCVRADYLEASKNLDDSILSQLFRENDSGLGLEIVAVTAAVVTSPYPTIFTHKNMLPQYMVAEFTLQATLIALVPLRVPVVLTTDLFMPSKTFRYTLIDPSKNNLGIKLWTNKNTIGQDSHMVTYHNTH